MKLVKKIHAVGNNFKYVGITGNTGKIFRNDLKGIRIKFLIIFIPDDFISFYLTQINMLP